LEAAGTKWNFLKFKPGLVGGHCIGVDPFYLAQKAQEVGYHPEIILAGRRLNDSMGKFVATEIIKLMMRKDINTRTKRQIAARIFEIKFKPPSQADTPPHTHLGTLRRSITYQYDPSKESVVVGAFMDGAPFIAALHEHGGTQRMAAWAWIPRYDRGYKGIISWYRVGKGPRNTRNWQLTESFRQTFVYPARPFMFPAMMDGVRSGRIAKEFEGRFRMG
jgi:hypothetical protein